MAFAPPRPWRMRSQTRRARSRGKSLHGRTRQPECAGEVAAGKRNAKRQYAQRILTPAMICGHPKCAPACRGKSKDRLGKIAESDRLANNAAFVDSLEQSGTCQLYSPDRAAHIKWALCLDEGRGLAAEDPYVRVRRLLPHQTRQESGDTSDFYFHNIMHGFMAEASNRERFFPLRKDRKLHNSRFWRGRHH